MYSSYHASDYVQKPKKEWEYAQAYVPFQEMHELYTPEKGLKAGTVFPELDQPYCKRKWNG